MAEFRMPSLGADMDRGTLLEWRVAVGDRVERGDIIAVVDTDKSDIEVEVFDGGVVTELLVPEGTEVAVGTPLAHIEAEAATASPPAPLPSEPAVGPTVVPTVVPAATAEQPVAHPAAVEALPHEVPTRPKVFSPLVRHRAEELGVDLDGLVGSGAGGVITRA
ncbi:MAG: biotin/lipoyl-containing protein, partial [Acidimicrobiales bacterium]